jgi:4-alpha-glucanotransferase
MLQQKDGAARDPASPHEDPPEPIEIEQAARAWGVQTDYWDIWGKQHHATPDLETAILQSLGVDLSSKAALRQAIESRTQRQWRSPLAPTIFLTAGTPFEIPVSLPVSQAGSRATLRIHLEDGRAVAVEIALGELPAADTVELDGRPLVSKRVRLPDDLPLGYHEMTIDVAGEFSPPSRLIVCPSRAFEPAWLQSRRAAGLAISLYGLRSQRNWGCGDTTDLKALTDWVAERTGTSFIALNPLHAIPNRQPYNTSPYLPNSIFYRNPIYLDVQAIPDFAASSRAAALFQSPGVQKEISTLRNAELVEYERVYSLKLRFLKLLFQAFLKQWRDKTPRSAELKQYIEREGELLHRFAVHSALDQAIQKKCPEIYNWKGWPEHYQDPESPATREFAEKHWRSVLFYKYIQWQLDLQLAAAQQHAIERGLSIGLYHDLALATDRYGSDLWAQRDFFVAGCRVGAPPDGFSPKGQDWGFPPPNSDRHVEDGYGLFAESIRKNCRHGGALRIDHVMRFFRLYWIPDGMEATDGTYVRDRFEALLSILALESVRNQVIVIGEDLGTVPDEAREVLHRFGILSYRLLYFEQDNNGRFRPPQDYPRDALVSATTHDLPTLAGFWLGKDIDARRDAGLLTDEGAYRNMRADRAREKQKLLDLLIGLKLLPDWFPRDAAQVIELVGELHNAIVGFLASTPSKLMVLNQEDLLKQAEQQNLPGSTAEYPNWRRKMKCTVEELWTSGEIQDFARMFRLWLDRTGRLNVPGQG